MVRTAVQVGDKRKSGGKTLSCMKQRGKDVGKNNIRQMSNLVQNMWKWSFFESIYQLMLTAPDLGLGRISKRARDCIPIIGS